MGLSKVNSLNGIINFEFEKNFIFLIVAKVQIRDGQTIIGTLTFVEKVDYIFITPH